MRGTGSGRQQQLHAAGGGREMRHGGEGAGIRAQAAAAFVLCPLLAFSLALSNRPASRAGREGEGGGEGGDFCLIRGLVPPCLEGSSTAVSHSPPAPPLPAAAAAACAKKSDAVFAASCKRD